jgi:hypothetical protein
MTLNLNVRQNGRNINLPVSRAQRTFARAVDNELTVVLGADAIAYSTVTKYQRQRQFTFIRVGPLEEPATIVIDQAILMPLSIIHSLLFESWLASPAFQPQQFIDT